MPSEARKLEVVAGVMAGKAVDLGFVGKVEAGILPTIADVARLAERLVGTVADAEAVEHGLLAQTLTGIRVYVVPGPVPRGHDLLGCLALAAQTGPRYFFATGERTQQGIETSVIGGGCLRQAASKQERR